MSDIKLGIGEMIRLSKADVVSASDEFQATYSFSAGKGRRFVALLLGFEPSGRNVKAAELMTPKIGKQILGSLGFISIDELDRLEVDVDGETATIYFENKRDANDVIESIRITIASSSSKGSMRADAAWTFRTGATSKSAVEFFKGLNEPSLIRWQVNNFLGPAKVPLTAERKAEEKYLANVIKLALKKIGD